MDIFRADEIFQFAVRIEENGVKFYQHAAQVTKDEGAKALFLKLADDEMKHRKMFEYYLARMESVEPPERYPGEYIDYVKNYIDDKIVFTQAAEKALPTNILDTLSALEFAMQRELDSILYYHEVKRFVSSKQHEDIDKIIQEEWRHYTKLSELKKKTC